MDLQASDSSQTDTNSPERKALLEPIRVITGLKEEVELSTDDEVPSQLLQVDRTIPEVPNPKPIPPESHLPKVIYFDL